MKTFELSGQLDENSVFKTHCSIFNEHWTAIYTYVSSNCDEMNFAFNDKRRTEYICS